MTKIDVWNKGTPFIKKNMRDNDLINIENCGISNFCDCQSMIFRLLNKPEASEPNIPWSIQCPNCKRLHCFDINHYCCIRTIDHKKQWSDLIK